MLHGQVQRRAPRLPLLSVDVGPRGHEQQQTRQAVARHGHVNGVQTCSPSTGMVTGREGRRGSACLVLTESLLQTVFTGAVRQLCCMETHRLLSRSQETLRAYEHSPNKGCFLHTKTGVCSGLCFSLLLTDYSKSSLKELATASNGNFRKR